MAGRAEALRLNASQSWLKRAALCEAAAATNEDTLPGDMLVDDVYPNYVGRAKGPSLWAVDDNNYTDYILGYGPLVLGHADSRVTYAGIEELQLGTNISPLW